MLKVRPYVQEMIAGTNGRTYIDVVHRLKRYPIPRLPVAQPAAGARLLDIGCGWGRWLVAASRRGFVPVGIDIRFEAALASSQVLRDFGAKGYAVVADLQALPFAGDSFDFVWSFSVIQHVHRSRAIACLREIRRVMRSGAECKLELPLRNGIRNRFLPPQRSLEDDPQSWCVRYYTIEELREAVNQAIGPFWYEAHCYLGIGFQPVDVLFVPWRYKPLIVMSMLLTWCSSFLPFLRRVADSGYVSARKRAEKGEGS